MSPTIDNIAASQKRRLTTIVASDICGYSSLSEKDELSAIRLSDKVYSLFNKIVSAHDGRVFKRIADGFLAEFPSAHQAMRAALEYQATLLKLDNYPSVRTGIHVGDVIDRTDGDILGHGVNIAVRLQEQARENGILASLHVVNLLGQDKALVKTRRGNLALKNIDETIVAFDIESADIDGSIKYRSKNKRLRKPTSFNLIIGLFVVLAIVIWGWRNLSNIKIEAQITEISKNSFGINSLPDEPETLSSAYIRQVLSTLAESKTPSQKTAYALIRQGSVADAISELETSLGRNQFGSKPYIDTLHQIAALSYHHDPKKASAYYEGILEIDSTDRTAYLWLFRSYNHLGNYSNAKDLYNKHIVQDQELSDKAKLRLLMDLAFSQMLDTKFQSGADLLFQIESNVIKTNDARLLVEWQTSLSLALERLNRLDEAESLLVSTFAAYENMSEDTNLPRAYNIMGQIKEKRAKMQSEAFRHHMEEALNYYRLQKTYGQQLNKPVDIAEALYYIGNAYITLEEIDQAKQHLSESQLNSIARELTPLIYRNHIGLARIADFNGDENKACEHALKARKIETDERSFYISPDNAMAYAQLLEICLVEVD